MSLFFLSLQMKSIGAYSISQLIPSSLRPVCSIGKRFWSSQRNTPANFPRNGTTALLKMLLEVGIRSRGMTGLRSERQTTVLQSAGLSSHGIFGMASPLTVCFLPALFILKLLFRMNT